jgi:PIN domain nuclease of toxin-antitoxin system
MDSTAVMGKNTMTYQSRSFDRITIVQAMVEEMPFLSTNKVFDLDPIDYLR